MATISGELPQPFVANIGNPNPLSGIGFNAGLAFVDFFGSAGTYERTILVSQASTTVNDTAFWTKSTLNGASIGDGGLFMFQTGNNPAASASLQSTQVGILHLGALNLWNAALFFPSMSAPANGTKITVGPCTVQDGLGFQWRNGAFGIMIRVGGLETFIPPAQFNGDQVTPNYTQIPFFSILYAPGGAQFFLNNQLLHTFFGSIGVNSNYPLRAELANTGNTTNQQLAINGMSIQRMGLPTVRSTYARVSAPGTWLLKTGAGTLDRALITTPHNNKILTLYDNVVASGPVLASFALGTVGDYLFDLDFRTGLTAVSDSNQASVTLTFQ